MYKNKIKSNHNIKIFLKYINLLNVLVSLWIKLSLFEFQNRYESHDFFCVMGYHAKHFFI